eukprot:XP_001690200.1 predicted protein [Chlamydomonas reinhardtii]
MDPATKAIYPTQYEGVKVVSFGYAGQGSAIMRGPMVSGLIQQMLTTADWGERIQRDFGLPNLIRFPIVPDLSAAGDVRSVGRTSPSL